MSRLGLRWIAAFLLLTSAGATAQATLRGPQASSGLPRAASVATSSGTASTTAGAPTAASEPKSVAGMLAAQNNARSQLGLPPLTWSTELTAKAEATAGSISEGVCTRTQVEKAGASVGAAVYWAPGVRGLDGSGKAQDISPAYLITEWKAGRADYDTVRGECRRTGACEQYARMIAPPASAVGCAKAVCPSQAQVWACHYARAEPAGPELRQRQGN